MFVSGQLRWTGVADVSFASDSDQNWCGATK
jgi:hypothetical protein